MSQLSKIELRRQFLETCTGETRTIHTPIVDTALTRGHLNPAGLGDAAAFSQGSLGQSTDAFDSLAEYHHADETGAGHAGGAEYAIVRTPEAGRVCKKFAELHGGQGAIIVPSGLSAISTVFETYLHGKASILLPDNRYYPAERVLTHLSKLNPQLAIYHYSARAGQSELESLLAQIKHDGRRADLLYLEAPGSQTFEIPAIAEMVGLAKSEGVRTVMDNTWASHVRFQPLRHGIDIVIQATTKYEGGYGDTPSGVVIAADEKDFNQLAFTSRANGTGVVSPQTCNRLYNRVASAPERIERHYTTALQIMAWFQEQDFTAEILSPALPQSLDHERFQTYFGKGNGLFTVRFNNAVAAQDVSRFVDRLNLFRVGESWGGHVSLTLPATPTRTLETLPPGQMVRFSMGLENTQDLLRDLAAAAKTLEL